MLLSALLGLVVIMSMLYFGTNPISLVLTIKLTFLQDSFELPRRDSSRDEEDVEMGMHQPDASDNFKRLLEEGACCLARKLSTSL